jgi:hypothetical protein
MGSERRRSPRIELLGRVHGHVDSLGTVNVREMSLGGMSMETPFPFEVGSRHPFNLTLGDGASVLLTGLVKYSRESTAEDGSRVYVTGVQFVDDETEGASPDAILDRLS